MACVVEGRPVILLAHKHDEPGRVGFLVAHEAGHVAVGDCATGQPVVDEEEEIADDAEVERRADRYANRVLVGGDEVPGLQGGDFRALARGAAQVERETGADASAVVFAWARRTSDYAKATMAVRALYRSSGARRQLRQLFDQFVDPDAATEGDRALLRCVHGDPERDEAGR
jgi:Zn-dependent peptidase ImmA (M78 family)